MKQDKIKDGDIITFEDGDREVAYMGAKVPETSTRYLDGTELDEIVKIERPTRYETIYEKTTREMTVAEISKALGYEVKVVK